MGRPIALVVVLCGLSLTTESAAEATTWLAIGNRHLAALSDAPAEQVLPLLEELEWFRVAVASLTGIGPRPGQPRVPAILLREDFSRYAPAPGLAGYVLTVNRQPLMVMPVAVEGAAISHVLRHEYVHVLLARSSRRLPRWYEEGLAEVLAATRLEAGSVTFGVPPQERLQAAARTLRLEALVADDDPHRHPPGDPYLGYWLLVHWFVFGDDERQAALDQVLRLQDSGQPARAALEQGLGMSLATLWDRELAPYLANPPTITLGLDLAAADLDFAAEKPPPGEPERLLAALESRVRELRQGARSP